MRSAARCAVRTTGQEQTPNPRQVERRWAVLKGKTLLHLPFAEILTPLFYVIDWGVCVYVYVCVCVGLGNLYHSLVAVAAPMAQCPSPLLSPS